jgi:nucleotide-binding universal stress UspA family protein
MYKRILFAYDGSEHSKRAAKVAGELARLQSNTEIWLICVMEQTPKHLKEPTIQEYVDAQKQAAKKFFKSARELIGKDVIIHDELLFGPPAENILQVSNQYKCDLIIMGALGLSVLEGLLLGSQVHKVIAHSKIPVLVVK